MLIPQLVALAKRNSLVADPLFEEKAVKWQVMVGPKGEFRGLSPLNAPNGRLLDVPKKAGGNAGGVATFGTDNARFVLGLVDDQANAAKAKRDLAAFIALLELAASEEPSNERFAAAVAFYRDSAAFEAALEEAAAQKVKEADRVALAYFDDYGTNLFESGEAKTFWRGYRAAQEAAKPQRDAVECLSCGRVLPAVKTNDTKIMGVPGGQPSGTALVSFDKEAFQSHGWDKNANAAVCEECSQAYTRALNKLLQRDAVPKTRVDLAGNAFVIWSDAGPVDILDELEDPNHERASARPEPGVDTLQGAYRPRKLPSIPPDGRLFALGLKGNGGRAVVTEWFDTTLKDAWENVQTWFDDTSILLMYPETRKEGDSRVTITDVGQPSRPQPLTVLARSTARDFKDIGERIPGALLRAALKHEPLPRTVAQGCLERIRSDGFGDYFAPARMGLIRCYLNRLPARKGMNLMPGLDSTNKEPAYVCGRLFATLDAVQFSGVGDVGANIVDRFYGRAATAPALVFGQLLTLAQSHLGTMPPAVRIPLDKELAELLGLLPPEFPRTLTVEEQGAFGLGYWHQRAFRFAEINRRREERAKQDNSNQQPAQV